MKSLIYGFFRWLAVAATIAFLVLAGAGTDSGSAEPKKVMNAVCESADMTNLQPAQNQIIKRLYGINPSDYEFCMLYYPKTNMDVDELLLIKISDRSQEKVLREAVESRLDKQKKAFESYGVGQMELLGNHSFVESRSGLFLFVVNSKDDDVRYAFLNALEEE